MNCKKIVVLIALVSLVVAACVRSSDESKRINPNTPTLGKLNGVEMSIPSKYQFFPVVYEGDDIWNPQWIEQNLNRVPTKGMKIQSFSLLLHLPDFSPINPDNSSSWRHKINHDGFNENWITVEVNWNRFNNIVDQPDWLKGVVERSKAAGYTFALYTWRYELADENVYGLRHESLAKSSVNDPEFHRWSAHQELYYDAKNWRAKIDCERMSVEPFSVFTCEQTYVLPELNSIVKIYYNPKNLKDWRKIQTEVTAIIKQFEITDSKRQIN